MKKKTVNLVTAVGVLVVLSGAYAGVKAYVTKQEEKEQEAEEEETVEVVSVDTDNLKSIGFLIDKTETVFEKEEDSWIKSDDENFPVNQDKLTEAAGTLNSVEADRVLEDVEDLSEYGLDVPSNTITVTTEDDEKTVLQVGEENDSTSQYYIKKSDDDSTVYVVDSSVVEPFMKSLYDYAQGDTFPTVDSSTISKIAVEESDSSYVLMKDDESGTWNIESGDATDSVDSAKASSATSAFSSMSYGEFVNYDCEDLSEYGLDKPYAVITVDYQEEAEEEEDAEDTAEDETEDTAEDASEDTDEDAAEEEDAEDTSEDATGDSADEDTVEDFTEDAMEDTADEDAVEDSTEDATEDTADEDAVEDSAENGTEDTADEDAVEDFAEDGTEDTADEDAVEDITEDIAEDTADDAEDSAEDIAEDTSEDTTEDTVEEEDAEPVLVDKQLVIEIGNEADDDGRYVRVNDSNAIYTISNDTLDSFLGKTNEDFWNLTVNYLSVNNLESLNVTYGGNTYDVDVSRETSEDEDGESSTVTLSYQLDGEDIEASDFTPFYNKLINMAGQKRLTEDFEEPSEPELKVVFTDTDGNTETEEYYSYDNNFYAVVIDEKVYLVNKMTVKEMLDSLDELIGQDSEEES